MLLSDPTSRRQPLHLTRPSPPSGWPEDLHLQTAEHAQHTTKWPTATATAGVISSGRMAAHCSAEFPSRRAINPPASPSLQREPILAPQRVESATSFKSPLSKVPRPEFSSVVRGFPPAALPIGRQRLQGMMGISRQLSE